MHKVILSYVACGKKSHLLSMVNPRNYFDYTDDQIWPTRVVFKEKHLFHEVLYMHNIKKKHNLQLINQGHTALCKINSEEDYWLSVTNVGIFGFPIKLNMAPVSSIQAIQEIL